MPGKAVRGLMILGVIAVSAAFSLSIFLENASGQFLEILRLNEAGVKLMGLGFIPLALYLMYRSVQ